MQLNDQNFSNEIENYKGVALVDFFAPWCGPCQLMAPIIDKLTGLHKDKNIKITKINVDENKETASKYNIMSIPTIAIFKDGKVVEKNSGYCSKDDLQQLIDKYINQ